MHFWIILCHTPENFLTNPHFSLVFGGPSHAGLNAPTWLDDINLRAIKQLEKTGQS